ncbi:phosphoglucosamine mutase [Halomonadaceae bacterium KBTZ08]
MGERKYFGTDGIRGQVGVSPISPDFILKLGWAAGRAFRREGQANTMLIGKDTRLSGYMFESALQAGLSAAGMDVRLLGPMPTPAIAYLTRTFRAAAGIVISASHNPHGDNGIKFFSADGTKLDDALEARIEQWIDAELAVVSAGELGKAARIDDAPGRYIEFCKSTVPGQFSLEGLHLVVDCAHGATYHVAPAVFRELGARVTPMGMTPDGLNINDGCGSTSPEAMRQRVLETGADLGVAFDGDGDRVIMVDHTGREVDGDELLYIIARERADKGGLQGGVVGTLMTNLGIEQALGRCGIPFARARVGDRYVMEELVSRQWLVGGEGSGHIVCRDRTTTGDGIVSALQVLVAMNRRECGLATLLSDVTRLPQETVNVRVGQRFNPEHVEGIRAAVSEAESELGERGRILLRPSGTEPVIRVMAEGEDADYVGRLVRQLADVVQREAP